MEPLALTPEQENDVRALLTWAFMSRQNHIPMTGVLGDLWRDLTNRDRERHTPAKATA